MLEYNEVEGDLIKLALGGEFDVITHGCNCMCNMGAGIAPQMAKAFGCDKFAMEHANFKGEMNKLGWVEYEGFFLDNGKAWKNKAPLMGRSYDLFVVNSYTQYNYGKNHSDGSSKPLDYEALTLGMRKINHIFKGKHIGLPRIGCGLAGGDWFRVKQIIQKELKDCKVTVVVYKP